MRSRANTCVHLLPLLLVAVLSLPAAGTVRQYVEDFTTKDYCDTLNTTADWDSLAGEIRLAPFQLTLAGSYDTPELARGIAIAGDYAYVADFLMPGPVTLV